MASAVYVAAAGEEERPSTATAPVEAQAPSSTYSTPERETRVSGEESPRWGGRESREIVALQGEDQRASEPAPRFLELLRSALFSGEAHLIGRDGAHPLDPRPWGWERATGHGDPSSSDIWTPRGRRIGWVDGEDVFLDPDAAVRAAQAVGAPTGDPLAIPPATVVRRLRDAGFLKSTDPDQRHLTIQLSLGWGRPRVAHLDAALILGETPPPQAPPTPAQDALSSRGKEQEEWECPNCEGQDSWRSALAGSRVCRICHPPAAGAEAM